ncbi:hypothetical protein AU074_03155 [Pseudomonas sp. ATCC PTA-122608]|uniref:hypothetical protein n=1 Tax=Pseudomonas sp. ATCC PTA-122608 TaxID=1771311 RepID=UPI00096BAA0B|nr:hypothetical protein [Pseudomonas sp. ATCC PTA-122608]OLY76784.1 hypothetical protein AU074_03155 [Pseudomonas sp. ATCC PTA-122608]
MLIGDRLVRILRNNPGWVGRVFESFVISAFKAFEERNPCAHHHLFDPATNERPACYLNNPIFDSHSEDNGETDVSDIYVCFPQPIFDRCGVTDDPFSQDTELFCRSIWNGWALEVKTKVVDEDFVGLRQHVLAGTVCTALPLAEKAGWMATISGEHYIANNLKRRWADFYIYVLYQFESGYPDFSGERKCAILVIPTIILNSALVTSTASEGAQSIQLNVLAKQLGDAFLTYQVPSIADIPRKILELVNLHHAEMFNYKREGEALKKQWYLQMRRDQVEAARRPGKKRAGASGITEA